MPKAIKYVIPVFISCFLFSSCVQSIKDVVRKDTQPSMEIKLPDRYAAQTKTVPIDIKMVCAAVLNQMRHRGETKFVRFDPAAAREVREESFDYEGFETTLIDITGFEAEVIARNKVQGVLEGVFHFEDSAGLRASSYFATEYLKTPDGINIRKAATAVISPVFPRVEAYFVPAEAFGRLGKDAGFLEMYAFALENSLDMKPTGQEKQDYQAYKELSLWKKLSTTTKTETRKLAVLVFCLDRVSNPAGFEVTVSENRNKRIADPGYIEPGYVVKNGWPIGVVTGEFSPDSWVYTFDINAYYTPEGEGKKVLIGQFSNQKSYELAADKNTGVAGEEGPIASGSVFLNPSARSDAMTIQKRLADLGHYNMTVDGQFGPGSQKALQGFKRNNGLGDNGTWDMQTQRLLFKGSGL
ncbi:MAG: peptidoglycan-binding protein [Proteobacteria bacterium]|nr:peptidoglycan-binding protein [Pseudomonadota bacterium]